MAPLLGGFLTQPIPGALTSSPARSTGFQTQTAPLPGVSWAPQTQPVHPHSSSPFPQVDPKKNCFGGMGAFEKTVTSVRGGRWTHSRLLRNGGALDGCWWCFPPQPSPPQTPDSASRLEGQPLPGHWPVYPQHISLIPSVNPGLGPQPCFLWAPAQSLHSPRGPSSPCLPWSHAPSYPG